MLGSAAVGVGVRRTPRRKRRAWSSGLNPGPSSATVTASTGGSACITGDIDTGHRVQVSATLPEQEINAIIVQVPVSVDSSATAKFEE